MPNTAKLLNLGKFIDKPPQFNRSRKFSPPLPIISFARIDNVEVSRLSFLKNDVSVCERNRPAMLMWFHSVEELIFRQVFSRSCPNKHGIDAWTRAHEDWPSSPEAGGSPFCTSRPCRIERRQSASARTLACLRCGSASGFKNQLENRLLRLDP